ncbi:MAG: hypothetical protein AAFO94_03795 [Bacteroidota bacterium]
MKDADQSIWYKAYNPMFQAGFALLLSVGIMLGALALRALGLVDSDLLFPWMCTTSIMLVFALFNSVFSLGAEDMNKYWSRSVMSFAAFAVLSGFVAYFLSGTSIGEAKTYKWIYFVTIFSYLVFLSIIRFMKGIIEFAQKEEWNQPKIRKR